MMHTESKLIMGGFQSSSRKGAVEVSFRYMSWYCSRRHVVNYIGECVCFSCHLVF
jgi:hypothetical protein